MGSRNRAVGERFPLDSVLNSRQVDSHCVRLLPASFPLDRVFVGFLVVVIGDGVAMRIKGDVKHESVSLDTLVVLFRAPTTWLSGVVSEHRKSGNGIRRYRSGRTLRNLAVPKVVALPIRSLHQKVFAVVVAIHAGIAVRVVRDAPPDLGVSAVAVVAIPHQLVGGTIETQGVCRLLGSAHIRGCPTPISRRRGVTVNVTTHIVAFNKVGGVSPPLT